MSKLHLGTTLFAVCALMTPLVGCVEPDEADTPADEAGVAPPVATGVAALESATRVAGPTNGGVFVIKPRGNDNSYIPLRVTDGAYGNGITQVYGDAHMDSQFIAYRNLSDGTWTFKDVPTKRCLDVYGNGTTNGTAVQMWTCHGGDNQRFHVIRESISSTENFVTPKHAPSMRLDVGGVGNRRLQIYQYNGTSAQRMTFNTAPSDACEHKWKVGDRYFTTTSTTACRNIFQDVPDTTSPGAGVLEAIGGWKPALAATVGGLVALVTGSAASAVILSATENPVAAGLVGGCIGAAVGAAVGFAIQDGDFEIQHLGAELGTCIAVGIGTASRPDLVAALRTNGAQLATEISNAVNRYWPFQGTDWEFSGFFQSAVNTLTTAGGVTRSSPLGLGFWAGVPGGATDIGAHGSSVWIIGTTPEPGGYGIYMHNGGGSWTKVPGGAVRIAAGPNGEAWIVNSSGQIFQRTGGTWKLYPGLARDIGVGADGSVWIIGTTPEYGGFGIYKLSSSGWTKVPGAAVRIAVGGGGQPWVVNSFGQIIRGTADGAWTLLPGAAKDIGVSGGDAWVIGTDSEYGGNGIQWYNGSSFIKVAGGAVGISVGSNGRAWIVNSFGQIFGWK